MRMKFKAAILTEINKPLIISEIEDTDLKFGQVLVKVLNSGLCGAQLQEISGLKGNAKFIPHLLGHEGCGIVEKIGYGVTTVKPGDKVVMHWRKNNSIESEFPMYKYNGNYISSGKVTTLSEYSIVSENRLTTVPYDTPNELCSLLGCGITTALGVISNEANVKFGESVLILGCGGVGLSLIQGAKLANAYPVIGVDVVEYKRNLSIINGVDYFYNILEENILDSIKNGSIDVIVDTTGNVNSIEKIFPLLSGNGRFILVGQPKHGDSINIPNAYNLFDGIGKSIKATQGGMTIPYMDIPKYVKLYKAGILNFTDLITHNFPLDDINEAIDLLKTGEAGRIIINM